MTGDGVRYYSLRWDGKTHYVAECDRNDLLICVYRGYHCYRRNSVVLYPFRLGMAYGEIRKKEIDVKDIMPMEWRFKRLG